jgi:L-galactose dehydrogenase
LVLIIILSRFVFCRNPSIATTLVGMASTAVVRANVQAVLQALGCDPNSTADAAAEKAALSEVERILAPVKNITWQSGKPENN